MDSIQQIQGSEGSEGSTVWVLAKDLPRVNEHSDNSTALRMVMKEDSIPKMDITVMKERIIELEKKNEVLTDLVHKLYRDVTIMTNQYIVGYETVKDYSIKNKLSYEEAQKELIKMSIK